MLRSARAPIAPIAWLLLATGAVANDRFVRVPFESLGFEGEPPQRSMPHGPAGWDPVRGPLLRGYVALDGPGRAFLAYPDEGGWSPDAWIPTACVLETSGEGPVSGRVFLPRADAPGFEARAFRFQPRPPEPEAERAFYAAMEAHYRRLLDAGLPGAAWFRHQVAVARAALELPSDSVDDGGPRGFGFARPGGFEDTFDLLTGERALAENLDLDKALRVPKNEEATLDVGSIEGVTTRAMDWKSLVKDLKPDLDPLAKLVPADQHGLFFPSFQAMVRVFDEVDEAGTPVLQFASASTQDQLSKQRYQEQLCLPLSAVSRLLGSTVVASVAITGSDPFLPSGTDLAILFECKQPDVLAKYLAARHAEAVAKGARAIDGTAGGAAYSGARSDDRRVSSYVARFGDVVAVSNSPVQIERLAAAASGAQQVLAAADEYVWFRDRYRRGDPAESALLVLTDATIRRWASPKARIGNSRRTRAAAAMAEIQARSLDGPARGWSALGNSAAAADLLLSDDFTWDAHGVRSRIFGSLGFLTPLSEIDVAKVTPGEKAAYERFRSTFQDLWRNFFDPIALRLTCADDRLAADLTVMPLVISSDYRELESWTRGGTLPKEAGDLHEGTLFHVALALAKDSELNRMFRGTAGFFGSQFGADPLSWVGGGVALYAEQDAYWDELARAPERERFLEKRFYRLPLALHVEVKDPLRLAAFLTALRAFSDSAAPNMTQWQTKTWKEQSYVRVAVDESAGLPEEARDAALYYASTPEFLVLSLREDVVQHALDRRAARKAGTSDPARAAGWLGSSVGLRVDRDALDVIGALAGDELGHRLQLAAWSCLPILGEWKRLFPNEDPVAVHERLWGVRLVTPSGGSFRWNDEMQAMETSDYGSPASPKDGPLLPATLDRFTRGAFGLSFEGEGLRTRVELERAGR